MVSNGRLVPVRIRRTTKGCPANSKSREWSTRWWRGRPRSRATSAYPWLGRTAPVGVGRRLLRCAREQPIQLPAPYRSSATPLALPTQHESISGSPAGNQQTISRLPPRLQLRRRTGWGSAFMPRCLRQGVDRGPDEAPLASLYSCSTGQLSLPSAPGEGPGRLR